MTNVRQKGVAGPGTLRKRPKVKKAGPDRDAPSPLGAGRLAQVRLRRDEVEALDEVMRTLDLGSTSDALREGLRLLAKEAAEVRAVEEIRDFYGDRSAPLPDGVAEPTDEELAAVDEMTW
ncbi:hypothetical protein [Nocardia caishijiensis]|uniref:Ribbon-helix-helix CopG family protein n=1 Tax=Nocardia caishijiensis TaxID=184756 RepID=A0ABQ6YU35_9NOCA|nr:hypothetical protein [Nocardia caishijiensis]KAF0849080.1 hypothetical protein FNL39_101515 [Nocardia caishijiensis]